MSVSLWSDSVDVEIAEDASDILLPFEADWNTATTYVRNIVLFSFLLRMS